MLVDRASEGLLHEIGELDLLAKRWSAGVGTKAQKERGVERRFDEHVDSVVPARTALSNFKQRALDPD